MMILKVFEDVNKTQHERYRAFFKGRQYVLYINTYIGIDDGYLHSYLSLLSRFLPHCFYL